MNRISLILSLAGSLLGCAPAPAPRQRTMTPIPSAPVGTALAQDASPATVYVARDRESAGSKFPWKPGMRFMDTALRAEMEFMRHSRGGRIVRADGSLVVLNYRHILTGRSEDPVLTPGDRVFLSLRT